MTGGAVSRNIGRAFGFARKYGFRKLWCKIEERRGRNRAEAGYGDWLKERLPDAEETARQRETVFPYMPLISILVPAYETDTELFAVMASSVLDQSYGRLELCIADGSSADAVRAAAEEISSRDPRLKYRKLEKNEGISGNTDAALLMASGDYVGLLDHDDFLLPGALFEIVKALNEAASEDGAFGGRVYADAVYTDEDKYDTVSGRHFQPHFKPDFNLEYLRSNNYICHFFVVKRRIALAVGGFRKEYDGSQDHDFIFRCTERAGKVLHIPKVLYSWRDVPGSTSSDPGSKLYAYEAGKRAVEAHLLRMGEEGRAIDTENYGFYRVIYPGGMQSPCKALENFDRQNRVEVVYYGEVCNNSVTISGAEPYILFTAYREMKVVKGFLDALAACLERPGCAVACARVYGPDGRLADDVRMRGVEDPFSKGSKGLKEGYTGYFHTVELQQEPEVPTGCFLMKREAAVRICAAGTVSPAGLAEAVRSDGGHIYYEPWAVAYGQR